MKICIYGAGAIGGYLGVMLKRGGCDVSVIARGAQLEAIRSRGCELRIGDEVYVESMPASQNPADLGVQDGERRGQLPLGRQGVVEGELDEAAEVVQLGRHPQFD